MAAQCGVTTANIRSLNAMACFNLPKMKLAIVLLHRRCYQNTVHVDALSKGFSPKEIKPALYGEENALPLGMVILPEEI